MATGEKRKKEEEGVDPAIDAAAVRRKKKKSKATEVNVDADRDVAAGNPVEERKKKKKKRKIAAEEPAAELTGLEVYWKLPSLDPAERQAAALALVRELKVAQQAFEAGDGRKVENAAEKILLGDEHGDSALKSCSPELQYALPRLVRGVGSSNQCARQGFAAALSTTIHFLPCITGDLVVNLIEKEIEVSSSLKGQDSKDGLLGQLFAYASIIRAGRLIGDGSTDEQEKLAKNIAEKLLTLGFKKAFLREPAASIFLDLSDLLSSSCLQKSVFTLPVFLEWLSATPEVGGADALLLALKLWQKLPESISSKCGMLPKSASLKELVHSSYLDVLVPYLKESSSSHPRVHAIWNVVVDMFANEQTQKKKKNKQKNGFAFKEQYLITFWTRVVDENLLDSSHERKFLSMRLVLIFLSKLPVSFAPIILSTAFGRCLIDILSGQANVLHSAAQQFVSDLSAWADGNQDRIVLTIGFLQQSSSGKFDQLTKSSTVKQLLAKVTSEESCLLAVQNLQRLFVIDSGDGDESEDSKRISAARKIAMVELMCSFCKQALVVSRSISVAKQVARFLVAHIFLDGDGMNNDKVKSLLKYIPAGISKAVRTECIGKLRILLSEKAPRRKDEDVYEDLGYDTVEFFRSCWKKPEKGSVQRRLRDAIFQISDAIAKEENRNKRLEAMRSLLSQLFIQSLLEPGSVDDVATELIICCNKAFGKVVNVALDDSDEATDDEESPSMGDVLLDIILSILTQSPAPIRNAAEQLFALFCSEITSSGIASMLKVIGNTRQETLFAVQTDDDDDDDLISVEEVSDDEGSDLDDEDEDIDTNTADMDDDAMFKMDAHLAQILRAKTKGESDTQSQLLQFKFRVLGLLDTYLQKQSENPAVLTVLPTLFQTYLQASSDGHKHLGDRIASVLNTLLKAKSYPKGIEGDLSGIKDLLERLLIVASKTADSKLRGLAQGFVFWLLKVSQAGCNAANGQIVETMAAALDDAFRRKKNTLPISFFRDGAMRHPWLRGIAIGKLLDRCREGRTDFEKAEAMDLLSSLLRHYAKPGSNELPSVSKDVEPHLGSIGELIVLYFGKPLKKAKQASFFRFSVTCLEAIRVLFDKPLEKLVDVAAISSAVDAFAFSGNSKATRAKLESLLSQTN